MSGIKYYRLGENEELPDEFCAVRDINGEPSEYTFYEQMNEFDRDLWAAFKQSDWFAGSEYRKLQAENAKLRSELESVGTASYLYGRGYLKAENAKLRELVRGLIYATHPADRARLIADAAEFGIEVDG